MMNILTLKKKKKQLKQLKKITTQGMEKMCQRHFHVDELARAEM